MWGVGRVIVAAVLGIGFVGLAVFLASQGLDGADKWASVLSLFVGLGGLVLAVLALRSARGGTRASVRTGDVSGNVTGIKGTASSDVAADVRTRDVKAGGSVTGLDLTPQRRDD
jgi:hypothetical protein